MGEVEEAMALFNLEKRHLFYDRQHETKVVVAWNSSTILVCVRGSIARANFVDDAKVPHSTFCMLAQAVSPLVSNLRANPYHSISHKGSQKRAGERMGTLCVISVVHPADGQVSIWCAMQFLQMAHPPRRRFRGRVPRVHTGFQQTWEANGIRNRVLAHIGALLSSAEDRRSVQVRTHIILLMD